MDYAKLNQMFMQCGGCEASFETCNPRILPCLHSICQDCFIKLQDDETPVCPFCSEAIDWTLTKPEHIPEDHHRRSVIDYLKVKDNRQGELRCYHCKSGNVSVRCIDCAASYCPNCLPGHDIYTKAHNIIPLSDVKEKEFCEVITPVLCAEHNLPLTKYCHSDEKAICQYCEFSNHQQVKDHLVEDIVTAYSDRKDELQTAIAEFRSITDVVESQNVNVTNEISNLGTAKEELERNFDASVENIKQHLERRRKQFKTNLKSKVDEQDSSLDKKLKYIQAMDYKFKEALHFAENGLTYLGPEDFCQIEHLIAARFNSLMNARKPAISDDMDMQQLTFLPCKVGDLDKYVTCNKWLMLLGYYLDVTEELTASLQDEKCICIGFLYVYICNAKVTKENSNPFTIVVKSKEGRIVETKVKVSQTKKCFEIRAELTDSGDYCLELYLDDKLKERRNITFTNSALVTETKPDDFPYGHKERLDHLDPMTFRQEEMQCPSCKATFCLDDEATFPRLLPCLHVMGTDCIVKQTNNGTVECAVCHENHIVTGNLVDSFPKDYSRWNLSVYWKVRSEGDYIQCQDHIGVKASVWCQICSYFICDSCSRAHMQSGHQAMIPLPDKEKLRSLPMSDLHKFFTCEEPGHEGRLLELYCLSCEKVICHACQFVAHRTHQVDECTKVYEQRHTEITELLKQVTETQRKTERLSFHVREEIDILKTNVDNQLQRVRKTFNNCKATLDARKKHIDSEITTVSTAKETKLKTQLNELDVIGATIKTSSNRALDLMEFCSDVSFLKVYLILKLRLQSALDTLKQTHVTENALVWFIDDLIVKRVETETQKLGSIWPGNIDFVKSKHWEFPATVKRETVILILQFLDDGDKTVSLKNIRDFLKVEISAENGRKLDPKDIKIDFGDNGTVSVLATFTDSGNYNLMFFVMGTSVFKDGVAIIAEELTEGGSEETEKREGEKKDKGTEQTGVVTVEKGISIEIGQKLEDVIQIEDSWQRQTREQQASISRLQQENTQLKTSLTERQKTLKETEDKLKTEIARTQEVQKKAIDEMESKTKDFQQKVQKLEADLGEKTGVVTKLQEENAKLNSSLQETTKAAKENEDKQKKDLETAQQSHQKELEQMKQTNQDSLEKRKKAEADLTAKTQLSTQQASTIEALQKEIAELKAAAAQPK